jgi:hypothetical protein
MFLNRLSCSGIGVLTAYFDAWGNLGKRDDVIAEVNTSWSPALPDRVGFQIINVGMVQTNLISGICFQFEHVHFTFNVWI